MKLFLKHMGNVPNWSPMAIQKTFTYKRNKIFTQKQRSIRCIDQILEDKAMERTLKSASTFLVCVLTDHLEADYEDKNDENEINLLQFLDGYKSDYIWAPARASFPRNKSAFTRFDKNCIEITDLNFAAMNRDNPIRAKCPADDIIMSITFECDTTVSIFGNSTFLQTTRVKGKELFKPGNNFKTFFKDSKNGNNDRKNDSLSMKPGTSGLRSVEYPKNLKADKDRQKDSGTSACRSVDDSKNRKADKVKSRKSSQATARNDGPSQKLSDQMTSADDDPIETSSDQADSRNNPRQTNSVDNPKNRNADKVKSRKSSQATARNDVPSQKLSDQITSADDDDPIETSSDQATSKNNPRQTNSPDPSQRKSDRLHDNTVLESTDEEDDHEKTTEKYQKVKFTSKYLTIETEVRSQRFTFPATEPEILKLQTKRWIGRSANERREQWNELVCVDFDLFNLVRTDQAHGIVFVPYKKIFKESQWSIVEACFESELNDTVPENLCYLIYDTSKRISYTGLF